MSNENKTVYDSLYDHATEIAKLASTSRKRGKSDVWHLAFKRMTEAGAEGASVAFGFVGLVFMALAIKDNYPHVKKCDHCGASIVWSYGTVTVGRAIYCCSRCADKGDPRK